MDIMELGAIGELVGGVAVVASLIFVGLQIRQGNRLNQADAVRNYTREYSQSVLAPLVDKATAEMVRRGMNDFDGLEQAEQVAVHAQWVKVMLLGQADFLLRKEGLVPEAFGSATEAADVSFLKTPGAAAWWAHARAVMIPEYAAHLDELLRHSATPALTEALPFWGELPHSEGA